MNAVTLLRKDLHALACSDGTRYKSQVEKGEPENLRGVLEIFKDSNFYRSYASHWLQDMSEGGQAKPGGLLKLYQTLKDVHEQGEQRERLEREHYDLLEQQHAKVLAMKDELGHELMQALQVQKSQSIKETEAKNILDRWTADVASLRAMKATIEPQAEQARVARARAKQDIVALHTVLRNSIPSSLLALGDAPQKTNGSSRGGGGPANSTLAHGRVFLHRSSSTVG